MEVTTNQYDDSTKGGYSYEEKLTMVAEGTMNPKEIGLTDPSEAGIKLLEKKDPTALRRFADFLTYEASEVPLALRARWARSELKIIPANPAKWEDEWVEEHKTEHLIQCRIRSGTALATLQRLVTDPFLGFLLLMEEAAQLFRTEYEKQQEDAKNPTKS